MTSKEYYRTFGGIRYELTLGSGTRSGLLEDAKEVRKKGYGARIIKTKDGNYELWESVKKLKRKKVYKK